MSDESSLISAGTGGISGLIISIITILGFKSRLDKLEDRVVYRDTCQACKQDNTNQFLAVRDSQNRSHEHQMQMDKKLDVIIENLTRRRGDNP